MILRFKQFEGRYDQITGIAVDELWKVIKITKVIYDLNDPRIKYDESGFVEKQIDYNFEGPIEFDLILKIKRENIDFEYGFLIDGGSYAEEALITIELIIDPDREPDCYSTLNSWLQDTIRHEIEHLTHEGINRIKDRPDKNKTYGVRKQLRDDFSSGKGLENNYMYYLLEDEIGPIVHGMYRKAKTDKKPITQVFNEFLDIMIKEGIIKSDKRDLIFNAWVKEAKRLLPNAKFE